MCSTEMLFSNFVLSTDAAGSACLLPPSTAVFMKRLPRAPCLVRLGHATVCMRFSWKEASCQIICVVSLSHFAQKKETKSYQFLTLQVPQIQQRHAEGSG